MKNEVSAVIEGRRTIRSREMFCYVFQVNKDCFGFYCVSFKI